MQTHPAQRLQLFRSVGSALIAATVACAQEAALPHAFETYVASEIREGSALDASFLIDAPAGRHGHTVARGESLFFADGTAARFWGVNLSWEALYPDPEQVPGIVRRLRANGINMVRVTYLDSPPPRGLLRRLTPDTLDVDSDQLDRLDRFAAALIEGGIYLDVALIMGGPVAQVERGLDIGGKEAAPLQMIHPRIVAAHRRFAEFLLTHTNPHTGRTWGNEPGIAIVEVYNEGDPFYLRKRLRDVPQELLEPLHDKWRAWLQREGEEEDVPDILDLGLLDAGGTEADAPVRFLSDLQAEHGARMRAFVRRHGYRGAICDTAGGAYSPAARWAQRDADIQVAHYYHDHLSFGKNGTSFSDKAGCATGLRALLAAAWERDPRRPFVLGEWDFCWPNRYRAEGVPLVAAFAAMQGWAGALQFTYWSQSWDTAGEFLGPGGRIASVWRVMSDPMVMALYPAAAMMFLRGDVAAGRELVSPPVAAYTVSNWPARDPRAFVHRYGTLLDPELARSPAPQPTIPDTVVSDTGEIAYDRDAGIVTIDTPRSQAVIGMVGRRTMDTTDLCFELHNSFAVVTMSSLTDAPIASSDRLLLATVAGAQNTGFQAAETDGRTFLRAHGHPPTLAEAVVGTIILKRRNGLIVYALEPDGSRREPVPTVAAGTGTRLRLGPAQSALHYEVVLAPTAEAPD